LRDEDAQTRISSNLAIITTAENRADFVRARSLGVRSFPTFLSENGEFVIEVSGGYATAARLTRQLRRSWR